MAVDGWNCSLRWDFLQSTPSVPVQDQALSEGFCCWHFRGKLSLTMTRAPSMELGAFWGTGGGLIPPCLPTWDLRVHSEPHTDPAATPCLSLQGWERIRSQIPCCSHPNISCPASVARQSCWSLAKCVPIPAPCLFFISQLSSSACTSPVPQTKAFPRSLPPPQVRMMQSLMNILTSSTLLPRLNGENLLGRMGVLEHPPLGLLHPSGPSLLIKSSLPRLIRGKVRAGGGSGAVGASCCSDRLPAANAMEKMSPMQILMLSRPSPRIPASPALPAVQTRVGLVAGGVKGSVMAQQAALLWRLGGDSSACPRSSGGEERAGGRRWPPCLCALCSLDSHSHPNADTCCLFQPG